MLVNQFKSMSSNDIFTILVVECRLQSYFCPKQKFVDKDNSTQTGSSSFRITQSSSFRINDVKNEDDIESNHPLGGMHQTSCAICLDRFKDGEDICSAQNKLCPHEFHLECIFPWLLKSQDCPCCRRDYLTVEADASELAGDAATNATTTSVNSS
jgi:Ring finger domain